MAPFDNIKTRPTSDLIVLFLAGLIGIYLIGSMGFILVTTITGHDENLGLLINRLGAIVNSIVGAVIGFIGGRGVGNSEGYVRGRSDATYIEPHIPTVEQFNADRGDPPNPTKRKDT